MESNLTKNMETLLTQLENFVSTKTIVGETIKVGDTTIIPLVDVSFGIGAGAFDDKNEKSSKDSGAGAMGAKITPNSLLVIQNGQPQLINIKNQETTSKIIDMIPGIISKFNLDKLFTKKDEEELEEDQNEDLEDSKEENK